MSKSWPSGFILKVEAAGSSEMLVSYHITTPEDHDLYPCHHENLKSRIMYPVHNFDNVN